MTRTYAPEQLAYMEALAIYQAVDEDTNQHLTPIKEAYLVAGPRDDLLDAEMAIREACGWDAAFSTMIDSKRALVEWAHERAKHEPGYPMLAEKVFEKAKYHPTIYAKLVDLCLRWAA